MRVQSEEEPDEEPDEPEEEPEARATASTMPIYGLGGREFEFRTEAITLPELTDGHTLAERLTAASGDGWDYVETIPTGSDPVLLYRRTKRQAREARKVGFDPPGRG